MAEVTLFRPVAATNGGKSSAAPLSPAEFFNWEVVKQHEVPTCELIPCLDEFRSSAVAALRARCVLRSEMASDVLRRALSHPFTSTCPRGHHLQPCTSSWLPWALPCSVCGTPAQTDEWHSCKQCQFIVCGQCLSLATDLEGGGAFADIMMPALAKELLAHPGWLRYKARYYFCRADADANGLIGQSDIIRLIDRLSAELGLAPHLALQLKQQMSSRMRSESTLNEHAFESFFYALLSHAIALPVD